jgi:hypothetical protein
VQNLTKLGGYAGLDVMSWPAWWFSKDKFIKYIQQTSIIDFQWVSDTESYRFDGQDVALEGLICR